jgi:hypothetical protein
MRLVENRLHELVDYARIHSPYLSERYRELPENYSLSDLPIIEKADMIANFDDYVTDPEVHLTEVEAYCEGDRTDAGISRTVFGAPHLGDFWETALYDQR